ncbi:MAG TPA: non-homologous end-joining DNA ligase [Planctomycetota bacterium]|nr:non-homologous end-joining DNA ligase [Planctomycetota bacterium]
MKTVVETDVAGKRLALSRLEKIFYQETGFTKGDVIEYYTRISPVFLPHLKNRPLTLKRYPDGAQGMFFYEKNCPVYRPKWVKTATVWSEGNQRDMDYCLANDLPSLIWAVNLACLEFHTSLSLAKDVFRPTVIAFDLDPGPPADIIDCCQVAVWLKEIFDDLKLQSFPKTSGSKGLQIYVPLNTAVTYDQTKPFALALAQILEQQHPDRVTSMMKKSLRKGKVFVDWSQNDDHKTTVCVYSLRAKERPTASTPVTWDEVFAALKHKNASRLAFESDEVLQRVQKHGDLFEPVLKLKQKLPRI